MKRKAKLWLLSLTAVAVLCALGVLRSYILPVCRAYSVSSGAISREIRIVLVSDLHGHSFGKDNENLVRMIGEEEPDLILMAGDFLNQDSPSADLVTTLADKLVDIAPTYFSLGNHEKEFMERTGIDLTAKLAGVGVRVLELEYEDIEIKGQTIRLGGMYDYAFAMGGWNSTDPADMEPEIYEFLTEFQDTDSFKLMMSHRPESFVLGQASQTWEVDMVVCGHTHGGQVVLPVLGGLYAPDQGIWPKYVHGLYEKDRIGLLITSGLGSNPQLAPRFCNPPEIAVLTLSPQFGEEQ